jgi:hypothetical protein
VKFSEYYNEITEKAPEKRYPSALSVREALNTV